MYLLGLSLAEVMAEVVEEVVAEVVDIFCVTMLVVIFGVTIVMLGKEGVAVVVAIIIQIQF